jgi:hypothetical protein
MAPNVTELSVLDAGVFDAAVVEAARFAELLAAAGLAEMLEAGGLAGVLDAPVVGAAVLGAAVVGVAPSTEADVTEEPCRADASGTGVADAAGAAWFDATLLAAPRVVGGAAFALSTEAPCAAGAAACAS